jgi:hypothetical protein
VVPPGRLLTVQALLEAFLCHLHNGGSPWASSHGPSAP